MFIQSCSQDEMLHSNIHQDRRFVEPTILNTCWNPPEGKMSPPLSEKIIIVTASDSSSFEDLNNLIGSIHFYDNKKTIVVYDLGLEIDQLVSVEHYCNVISHSFSYENYPLHVMNLTNNAWKPIVIKLAVEQYGSIIFLEPFMELRTDSGLLEFLIRRDGFFSYTIGSNILDSDFFGNFSSFWKLDQQFLSFKPICSADAIGYLSKSPAYHSIILPWASCAENADCWPQQINEAEESNSLKKFPEDATSLSMLISNNTCYTCNRDYDFYAFDDPEPLKQSIDFHYLNPGVSVLYKRIIQKKVYGYNIDFCVD